MEEIKKETLTEKEEELLDVLYETWINKALFNKPNINHEKATAGINFVYSLSNLKPPQIVICKNPLDLLIAADKLGAKIEEKDTFDCFGLGYDSGWTAFYDYFQQIGINFDDLDFNKWLLFLDSGIWATLLYENYAFVCPGPSKISFNKDNNLHNENGKAIEWEDGWGLYFLNGVGVDDFIVTTPAEKLDPKLVLSEKNAEVRREIVRKIGPERINKKLNAKIIDKWEEYELLELPIEGMRTKAIYLKMRNPSIATYHVEGVPGNCRYVRYQKKDKDGNYDTTDIALHYRKPPEMQKILVHDNGLDWYQQGDVCVWPKEAKSLKPYPSILT